MTERWLPIIGYGSIYEISDHGRVKSHHRPTPRILKPYWLECRHLDGDPSHNHLSNLRYGTKSENTNDSVRHGTHPSARTTHCPQNHPYDEENTYVNPRLPGSRTCRACMRQAQKDYRLRQKTRAPARPVGRPRTGMKP